MREFGIRPHDAQRLHDIGIKAVVGHPIEAVGECRGGPIKPRLDRRLGHADSPRHDEDEVKIMPMQIVLDVDLGEHGGRKRAHQQRLTQEVATNDAFRAQPEESIADAFIGRETCVQPLIQIGNDRFGVLCHVVPPL